MQGRKLRERFAKGRDNTSPVRLHYLGKQGNVSPGGYLETMETVGVVGLFMETGRSVGPRVSLGPIGCRVLRQGGMRSTWNGVLYLRTISGTGGSRDNLNNTRWLGGSKMCLGGGR